MSRMHSLDVEPMGNNRIGMVQTLPSYVYYVQPTAVRVPCRSPSGPLVAPP